MKIQVSFAKLWGAHLVLMLPFVLGLAVTGIPVTNLLVAKFLAVALPLVAFVFALCAKGMIPTQIDASGVHGGFPAGHLLWSDVRSVRMGIFYVILRSHSVNSAMIPRRFLFKHPEEFEQLMSLIRQQTSKGIGEA